MHFARPGFRISTQVSTRSRTTGQTSDLTLTSETGPRAREQDGEVLVRVSRPAIVLAFATLVSATGVAGRAPAQGVARTAQLAAADAAQAGAFAEARRALNEGRYADVATILAAAPAADADRAVLLARAAIATGRDDDAEAILRAAAGRHPDSDAALELGLLLQRAGRRDEARRLLRPLTALPESPAPRRLARAGRAAGALGRFQEANADLRQAVEGAPDDVAASTAWGELFLGKHNRDDAMRCFQAALRVAPRSVDALLGMARAVSEVNLAQALGSVRAVLEINPSSPDAHLLLAQVLIDAGYEDAAQISVNKALTVNPRSPDAYALLAAIAYLQNRPADFDLAIARALAINGTYGEAYRIVAAQAAHHYRFDDAVALARKAVAIDPGNAQAAADLGMDLLRIGDEDEARAVLTRAFAADPYDVVTYNLLAVLDALRGFDTYRDGDLVVRLDHGEAAVLKDPVITLAHEALRVLSAKYEFTPNGPILIEVFPHHDDFAVRNLGLPGLLGALGACFGRVVTMDSPKAQPPGTFQWSATLWHELTHVITLQMSNQRVPRWLTEGISVYEEQRARPEWRRPMEEEFVAALAGSRVPAIGDIDASFGDPKTISLAYYQAGLIVGYLIDTYGQAKFNALVRSFANGLAIDAAFLQTLDARVDQVQARFARSLETSFGPLRRALDPPVATPLDNASLDELKTLASKRPDSYDVHLALGLALRRQGDVAGASKALNRAAQLFPAATGQGSPHALLADMAFDGGDQAVALDELTKQLAAEPVNVELARRIAGLLGPDAPARRVQYVYERIAAVDPFDAEAHATLGRLAMKRGDATAAIRYFRAAVAAGPADAQGTRCDLAEAYLAAGDSVQARRETVAVLERAPSYERAQELLLKLVGGQR